MIHSFGNKYAQDIWETNSSQSLPRGLWIRARALLTSMHRTTELNDLKLKRQPPHIRLHKLKGNRNKEWSVTIKLPWCITFKLKGGEFADVKIENYH